MKQYEKKSKKKKKKFIKKSMIKIKNQKIFEIGFF